MFQQAADYLAYAQAWRFVVANAGAIVYLNWERTALRLSPAELIDIANFLPVARAQVQQPLHCFGNHNYCLVHDEHGYYHVWLLGVGLYLTAADLDMLTGMVQQARQALFQKHLPTTSSTADGAMAEIQLPFSLN